MASGRFRELLRKYGKVALGVHCSVSAASITGLYVAIKNNLDVESLLDKFHMGTVASKDEAEPQSSSSSSDKLHFEEKPISENPQSTGVVEDKKRNRTAELAASTGGALGLAVLCNKALFPIRVPVTIALTPPIAKFLARRRIVKTGL